MADAITVLDGLKSKVRRAYWLMGDVVVREALVVAITAKIHAAPQDRISVSALAMADVRDQINAYGLDAKAPRLVVVRDAEAITDHEALESWLGSRLIPNVHAIFVSNLDGWEPPWWRKESHDAYRPLLREVFGSRHLTSMLVNCNFPATDIGRAKRVRLVCDWGAPGLSKAQALHILTTCGWDMGDAKDAAMKVAICAGIVPGGRLPDPVVARLVRARPQAEYVSALVSMDRAGALEAADLIDGGQVAGIVGLLDWSLDVLGKLNRGQRSDDTDYSLSQRLGVHRAIVEKMRGQAKHYDPAAVLRRSELLVMIDRAGRMHGQRRTYPHGVLQLIAARW